MVSRKGASSHGRRHGRPRNVGDGPQTGLGRSKPTSRPVLSVTGASREEPAASDLRLTAPLPGSGRPFGRALPRCGPVPSVSRMAATVERLFCDGPPRSRGGSEMSTPRPALACSPSNRIVFPTRRPAQAVGGVFRHHRSFVQPVAKTVERCAGWRRSGADSVRNQIQNAEVSNRNPGNREAHSQEHGHGTPYRRLRPSLLVQPVLTDQDSHGVGLPIHRGRPGPGHVTCLPAGLPWFAPAAPNRPPLNGKRLLGFDTKPASRTSHPRVEAYAGRTAGHFPG